MNTAPFLSETARTLQPRRASSSASQLPTVPKPCSRVQAASLKQWAPALSRSLAYVRSCRVGQQAWQHMLPPGHAQLQKHGVEVGCHKLSGTLPASAGRSKMVWGMPLAVNADGPEGPHRPQVVCIQPELGKQNIGWRHSVQAKGLSALA